MPGLLPLLVGAALAVEDCASRVSPVAWDAQLTQAEADFSAVDEAAFDGDVDAAGRVLPCLDGVVSPTLAARYHRLVGLRLYVRRDVSGATLAFTAARSVDPFGALPSALLPPGHEARLLADGVTPSAATVYVPRPRRGELWFDGIPGTNRPVDRPTLAQIERHGGHITSRYLAPGEPLPTYPIEPRGARSTRWVVLGGGASLIATSAVLYGFAAQSAATLEGPLPEDTWSPDDVLRLQRTAHGLGIGSAAAGVLGGATLGFAVVYW